MSDDVLSIIGAIVIIGIIIFLMAFITTLGVGFALKLLGVIK